MVYTEAWTGKIEAGEAGVNKVFISYVHDDSKTVDRLFRDLRQSGIDAWIDRESLRPGQFWPDAIRSAIRNGDFFIACFSNRFNKKTSSYMNEELIVAIEELRKRPIHIEWFIPILFSGEVPDYNIGAGRSLRDIQYLTLSKNNWHEGMGRLINVLKTDNQVDENRNLRSPELNKKQETKTKSNSLRSANGAPEVAKNSNLELPTWRQWKESCFPLTGDFYVLLVALSVIAGFVGAVLSTENHLGGPIVLAFDVIFIILMVSVNYRTRRWERNKYLLKCARLCFEAGHLAASAGYMVQVSTDFVDKTIVRDLCQLISLKAEEVGELAIATKLSSIAGERWRTG